jgi:hypothetical protein
VVSVIATGPKGKGFKPGRDAAQKPDIPCRKILLRVEDLLSISGTVSKVK